MLDLAFPQVGQYSVELSFFVDVLLESGKGQEGKMANDERLFEEYMKDQTMAEKMKSPKFWIKYILIVVSLILVVIIYNSFRNTWSNDDVKNSIEPGWLGMMISGLMTWRINSACLSRIRCLPVLEPAGVSWP